MMKLQIDSVDLTQEAFQPIVNMIGQSIKEAFEIHQTRKELPKYMKINQACVYMNCVYNTLQKYKSMGLRTIMLDGEEKIDKSDADAFMEKHKI